MRLSPLGNPGVPPPDPLPASGRWNFFLLSRGFAPALQTASTARRRSYQRIRSTILPSTCPAARRLWARAALASV